MYIEMLSICRDTYDAIIDLIVSFISRDFLEIPEERSRTSICEYDCESFGHICCKFGYGAEECREEKNCPTFGNSRQVLRLIWYYYN